MQQSEETWQNKPMQNKCFLLEIKQCSDHLLFYYKVTISFSLFRSMKKLFPYLMLERMTKCVPTVTKSLNIPHTWGSIFQLTLEKSPTFAQTVVEVSQDAAVSISTKESHVQNKQWIFSCKDAAQQVLKCSVCVCVCVCACVCVCLH